MEPARHADVVRASVHDPFVTPAIGPAPSDPPHPSPVGSLVDGIPLHVATPYANLYGAIGLAAGLSYLVGGFLLERPPRTVLVIAGAGGLATSAILALRLLTPTGRALANDDPSDGMTGDR